MWDAIPPELCAAHRAGVAGHGPTPWSAPASASSYVPQGVDRNNANQTGFTGGHHAESVARQRTHFHRLPLQSVPAGLLQPLGRRAATDRARPAVSAPSRLSRRAATCNGGASASQRQLPKRIFLDLSYVASRGTRLGSTRQYNAVPDAYLSQSPVRDQATINYLTAQVANPFYPLLPSTNLSGTTVARQQFSVPIPNSPASAPPNRSATPGITRFRSLPSAVSRMALPRSSTGSGPSSWRPLPSAMTATRCPRS